MYHARLSRPLVLSRAYNAQFHTSNPFQLAPLPGYANRASVGWYGKDLSPYQK